MESEGENYYLCWGGFQRNLKSTFSDLAAEKYFSDVTLVCEGEKQIEAHKIVLSASSPFFKQILFKNPHQHPLVYLKGVRYRDLSSMIKFIYFGEVKIRESDLQDFLNLSEELEVKGVSGIFMQPEESKYAIADAEVHDIQHKIDDLDLYNEIDLDKAVFIDEKDELSESVFKKDLEKNHSRPKYSVSSSVYSGLDDDNLLQDSPAQKQNLGTKETLKENPRGAKCSVSSSAYSEVGDDIVDQDISTQNEDVDNFDAKSVMRKSISLGFFSRSRSKERRRKKEKSRTNLNLKKLSSCDDLNDEKLENRVDDSACRDNTHVEPSFKCLNCDTKCQTKESLHRHMELKDHY